VADGIGVGVLVGVAVEPGGGVGVGVLLGPPGVFVGGGGVGLSVAPAGVVGVGDGLPPAQSALLLPILPTRYWSPPFTVMSTCTLPQSKCGIIVSGKSVTACAQGTVPRFAVTTPSPA
jgi:hypothetical protein